MATGEAAFEDGTINYLSLPAVEIGLKYIRTIGIELIHTRVMCLTSWLLDQLLSVSHSNGTPLVQVYGPHDCHMRGGTIALNILTPDSSVVDERIIDRQASARGISLRTGCFCNPGAGEVAFGLSKNTLARVRHEEQERMTLEQYLVALSLPSAGAIRVSLGLASNFADVYRCLQFIESFRDQFPDDNGLVARLHC